jgi:hypothetical protein
MKTLVRIVAPVAAALIWLVPAGPAAAATNYVAIGDSYSSGTGAGSYNLSSSCQRSTSAYPYLVAAAKGYSLNFVACSGATTVDEINNQVGALNTGTNLVIAEISVGSGIDTVTWWLNPTDGSSDSALTSSASASGSFTGNIVNDANPGSSFARLNWISQGWGNSSGASTFFDEPRLSTDLAGLGLVAVPEPTAAAVLGLVGLMGLGRRRRA